MDHQSEPIERLEIHRAEILEELEEIDSPMDSPLQKGKSKFYQVIRSDDVTRKSFPMAERR